MAPPVNVKNLDRRKGDTGVVKAGLVELPPSGGREPRKRWHASRPGDRRLPPLSMKRAPDIVDNVLRPTVVDNCFHHPSTRREIDETYSSGPAESNSVATELSKVRTATRTRTRVAGLSD